VWRERADGPDRLILDPEELARTTGAPHAVMDFAPSPDGTKIAYAVQAGGGEIGTLHVVDLATGKALVPPIDRIRYANVAWLDDGSGFFYSRLQEGYEKLPPEKRFADRTTHFRSLDAAGTERKVFSFSHNPDLKLPDYASAYVFQVPGTKLAGAFVFLGVERHRLFYLADLDDAKRGTAKWRPIVKAEDRVAEVWPGGGYLYARTAKDAPRFRVLRMPLDAPDLAKADVVVPASESVITGIRAARDALYVVRRDGATQSLWRLPHRGKAALERVALPFEGSVGITDAWPDRDGVVLALAGWTRAQKPYAYDPRGKLAQLPFVATGALDAPTDIRAREVRVRSHDGTEVPLSIVSRADVRLDGTNPTILYGYGAYGVTEDPFFNPRIYAWLQRGGVYAIAHVRGGGAFGEEWHMAGRKTTKANTWRDAIAAGEWLVANGYTSKAKLGIFGGSAGGIFVGRAITERPDLFAAAVPAVGVFDGPRFEASANGAANIPEFGSIRNEDEFRALMQMSTYHAIKDGTPYPGVLLVHGVNDIRVDVWQTLKAYARFAAATSSGRPVLMRLEYDSGHGQGSTRAQLQRRIADIWTFMLWQFGEPAFQPKASM
jgi:prolyl oligopeptidase